MKKTYGVNGMMEWNAIIPVGRTSVRVHFTGGTVTGYGVSPATFTTDNPGCDTPDREQSLVPSPQDNASQDRRLAGKEEIETRQF